MNGVEMQGYLSVAVAVAAALILFYGYWKQKQLAAALSRLAASLEEAKSTFDGIEDPQAFSERFDEIDAKLSDLHGIGSAWNEYKAFLIRSGALIGAARPASDFFDDRLPYGAETDLRSFDAVPGRLIAIGLLATFAGLTLALFIAAAGLAGRDLEGTHAALVSLLAASALKFVSSIAAIIASIWFVAARNKLLARVDRLIQSLSARLDTLVPPVRAERVAESMLAEMARQTELLNSREERLADAIARQLNSTLPANLREAIDPLADAVRELNSDMGKINEQALRLMLERFSSDLAGAAQAHSERMTAMLDQIARTVESVPRGIQAASERFSTVIGSGSDQLEASLQRSGAALAGLLEGTSAHMAQSAQALATVAEHLDLTVARVAETEAASVGRIEAADDTLNKAVDRVQSLLASADQTIAALAPLTGLAVTLDSTSTVLREAVDGITGFVQSSRAAFSQSEQTIVRLGTSAEKFASEMEQLDISLTGVFSQLHNGIEMFKTRVEETVDKMDRDISIIVGRSGNGGER